VKAQLVGSIDKKEEAAIASIDRLSSKRGREGAQRLRRSCRGGTSWQR